MEERIREHEDASLSADHVTDTDIVSKSQEDDLWIFGFGSLIWKAGTANLVNGKGLPHLLRVKPIYFSADRGIAR